MTEPTHGLAGEDNPRHKLSQAQVQAIRDRYAAGGVTLKTIAAEYGVNYTAVQKIVRGTRWAQAPGVRAGGALVAWTEAENRWLTSHADLPFREQVRHFRGRRTAGAVEAQRSRLGVTRGNGERS